MDDQNPDTAKQTLAEWRSSRTVPSYMHRDGRVYYRMADVLAWENKNSRDNSQAPPAT